MVKPPQILDTEIHESDNWSKTGDVPEAIRICRKQQLGSAWGEPVFKSGSKYGLRQSPRLRTGHLVGKRGGRVFRRITFAA